MSGLFRSVRVGWRGKGAVPTTPSLSPPVLSIAPVITGTTQVSQTLSVSNGTWLNSPTAFSYQWYRGATPVGTNAATYALVVGDIGSTITCVVTAGNGSGSTNAVTSAVGPVIDLAPANSVLPAITGTPTLGQTLSASTGTWNHTPTSYAYQWNRAGSPIASANAATYLLVGADVGTTITCTVTATNSGGSTPATSASVGPISSGSSSLTISTAPVLSGDAVVGQTIFATNGTYSATPDSYTPTWSVGGVVQSGQTGTTLLVLDDYAGLAIGYSEVAHKAAYTDSASNAATSTGAVANISLTNAITAFTRTSTSGDNTSATGLVFSVTFGSNVYEGYYLRAQVFSDSALTTQTQDVSHVLTHDDLQAGATINLLADGLTKLGPTDWLQFTVYTTSPNGYGYSYTYATPISPTDAVTAFTWSTTDKYFGQPGSLTNGNLTVVFGSGTNSIRSSRAPNYNKTYWEIAGGLADTIAIADASADLTALWGAVADGRTVSSHAGSVTSIDGGIMSYNGSRTTVGSWVGTDTIGVALDVPNNLVWFSKNNVWMNSGNPAAGTGGLSISGIGSPLYAAVQGHSASLTLNAGTTPGGTAGFAYTPPTGFVAP